MNYAGAGLILLSSDLKSTLLVKDTRTGKWGFPKGHRETIDTSDLATAVRECFEETGLTADDYIVRPGTFKVSKGGAAYIFRYAIMKCDGRRLRAGPAHEIGGLEWIPLQTLFEAQNVIDGNKYLRNWIADIKNCINKKSVNMFHTLLGGIRFTPSQESVSTTNIVTCA